MLTATEEWTEPYPKHARTLGHTKKTAKSSDIFRATSTVVLTARFLPGSYYQHQLTIFLPPLVGFRDFAAYFPIRGFLVRISDEGFVARGL